MGLEFEFWNGKRKRAFSFTWEEDMSQVNLWGIGQTNGRWRWDDEQRVTKVWSEPFRSLRSQDWLMDGWGIHSLYLLMASPKTLISVGKVVIFSLIYSPKDKKFLHQLRGRTFHIYLCWWLYNSTSKINISLISRCWWSLSQPALSAWKLGNYGQSSQRSLWG